MLSLTRTLAGLRPGDPLGLRLCLAFVSMTGASSGSIALVSARAERTVLCTTNDHAASYEDSQDLLHEGPSLEALRLGTVVMSLSEADQRSRWPRLTTVLSESDPCVHAIPIRPRGMMMGVLTVHGAEPLIPQHPQAEIEFLADAIGAAIVGEAPDHHGSSTLWTERDRVSQATGMVLAQLRVGPADALAVLRAHAFAHGTSVLAVSRMVIERELDFSALADGSGSP
ncbi:ANTAR domain-containing protein [Nocardioides sp.]|uniref:ANTAR domain-containing protein n=1 Tax=Nocardioides sp. TaxID=35761 RepID=UPI00356A790E